MAARKDGPNAQEHHGEAVDPELELEEVHHRGKGSLAVHSAKKSLDSPITEDTY